MTEVKPLWLPPIERCCEKMNTVIVSLHSNATIHFATDCSTHGRKGVTSPFAKSTQVMYRIEVSNVIQREFKKTDPTLF